MFAYIHIDHLNSGEGACQLTEANTRTSRFATDRAGTA